VVHNLASFHSKQGWSQRHAVCHDFGDTTPVLVGFQHRHIIASNDDYYYYYYIVQDFRKRWEGIFSDVERGRFPVSLDSLREARDPTPYLLQKIHQLMTFEDDNSSICHLGSHCYQLNYTTEK